MKKRIIFYFLTLEMILSICACSYIPNFDEYKQYGDMVNVEICMVKNDYKSIVTIISDDGYYESGTILNELSKNFDVNVTVAAAINIISPKVKEWKQIESEGHIDIVNHSYSHIKVCEEANLSEQQVRQEYIGAKEYLAKNFNTPTFTMVAPENTTTSYGFSVWQEMGILAARLGSRGENPLKEQIHYGKLPGEWLNLKMRGLYDAKNTAERNAWIDSAIDNSSWLIEMWHDISPNGDVHFQPISTKNAKEHIEYISNQQKEKNIWAASFTQAVSYIYQRDYGDVEAYRWKNSTAIRYSRLRDDLPWEDFNVPVTVKITFPSNSGINIKNATDGRKKLNFQQLDNSVLVDMETDDSVIFLNE